MYYNLNKKYDFRNEIIAYGVKSRILHIARERTLLCLIAYDYA